MTARPPIGIDLGTTNSAVAIVEGDRPVLIANRAGERLTPSVVCWPGERECTVGTAARRMAALHPLDTIHSAKRLIGRRHEDAREDLGRLPYVVRKGATGDCHIVAGRRERSAQEVSAMILRALREDAEDQLGHAVREAVITVPAYFDDAQRTATREAGRIAGLEVLRIIAEPTAAALAYGYDLSEDRRIAVFDFGGGTFDISFMELGGGVFEVRSTGGDTHLGGDDIDAALMEWIVAQSGICNAVDPALRTRLREAAEQVKIALSAVDVAMIALPFAEGNIHAELRLERGELERIAAPTLARLRAPCVQALRDSGWRMQDLDAVLLVGGSTRMPAVRELVQELFQREPEHGVNPDEAVALGAAIQGAMLSGRWRELTLLDVTPLSLGIETESGGVSVVIPRNTLVPTARTEVFSTARNGQRTVAIHIVQGERPLARGNRSLGRFILEGIRPARRGEPQIEVTFSLDADGILQVRARDADTDAAQAIRIEGTGNLSDGEIAELVRQAEQQRNEDDERVELLERASRYAGTVLALADVPELPVDPDALEPLLEQARALLQLLDENAGAEEIRAALSELESRADAVQLRDNE